MFKPSLIHSMITILTFLSFSKAVAIDTSTGKSIDRYSTNEAAALSDVQTLNGIPSATLANSINKQVGVDATVKPPFSAPINVGANAGVTVQRLSVIDGGLGVGNKILVGINVGGQQNSFVIDVGSLF